jgi:hypothetical protein
VRWVNEMAREKKNIEAGTVVERGGDEVKTNDGR